jgi:hypothetical protein
LPSQKKAAAGMDSVAKSINSKFTVALGDNFYFSGVRSVKDVRFSGTFEDVYTGASLQSPWYVCGGNHDAKGNMTAQIEYSNQSKRWTFPALYHAHSFKSDDGVTLDLILIDTPNLSGSSDLDSEDQPGYFDPLPLKPKSYAEDQWTWIEDQLKASTAQYILVGGHYPVYSVCDHGPTGTLVEHLRPLLEQYGAHYMSGHDHCMEHLQETGSKVNYYLSGMGDNCCYKSDKKGEVPADSLKWYIALDNREGNSAGFTSFSMTNEALTVKFHNQDGEVLYTAPAVAPRSV